MNRNDNCGVLNRRLGVPHLNLSVKDPDSQKIRNKNDNSGVLICRLRRPHLNLSDFFLYIGYTLMYII